MAKYMEGGIGIPGKVNPYRDVCILSIVYDMIRCNILGTGYGDDVIGYLQDVSRMIRDRSKLDHSFTKELYWQDPVVSRGKERRRSCQRRSCIWGLWRVQK